MFLKTFLEAGVPASKPFVCDARVCHLQDLGAGANALFRFDPHTFDRNDLAWSLIALAQLQAVKLFRADAKLKVLGHALECLGYAQTHRLFRPSVRAQHQIAQAAQAVRDLLAEVVILDLAAIRPRQAQLVQQVIGDACHAFWGLNLVSREGEQRCSRRDNTGRNAMGGVGRGG
jgi:hypothetical protein